MAENKKTKQKNKKVSILIGIASSVVVLMIGYGLYRVLVHLKQTEAANEASQEQFVGVVQVSEQLQEECQKSAAKIVGLLEKQDPAAMLFEYQQHAENCRDVFVAVEGKDVFRNEGNYPDLIIDIAKYQAQTNKKAALEALNFAKTISPWEVYRGPIVCSSKSALEAYSEAIESPPQKKCFNTDTDKEILLGELKKKNFSILPHTLSDENVMFVGTLEADSACPQKVSSALKIVENAVKTNATVEEEQLAIADPSMSRFVFKTQEEDRLILVFTTENKCFKLQSVLIPELYLHE